MTLLFRFRDLSCPIGETIERHKGIIQSEGYVHWGWWHKGHEKLPVQTIQELGLAVTPQEIYLFDSAQSKFYRAMCDGLESKYDKKIPSPNEAHTPLYYRENSYKMWLKLTSIECVEQGVIVGCKSYVQMDDLFSGKTHYEIYSNKVISSPEELAEQNRTIWRIRDKAQGDSTKEIRLTSLSALEPSHFDVTYRSSRRKSILWLSDIHFDSNGNHGFASNDISQESRSLSGALQSLFFNKEPHQISTLLISGDLTWKGTKDEFDMASQFIDNLISPNSLDKSWLAVCPGNHDLGFYEEDIDKIDSHSIPTNCDKSKAAYAEFYQKYFDIAPNDYMTSGRKFLLNGTIPVEIVLLNSVTLQQIAKSFQGHGFIGEHQLEDIAQNMGFNETKPRNVTRICVMHHHLIPVALAQDSGLNSRYSTVLDAERLSRWLTKYDFDFLLHGHMHQNFHCEISRHEITHRDNREVTPNKLNILALGSSGVREDHTGESKGNWVCQIDFDTDKIRFHYKPISSKSIELHGAYTLEFDYNA